MVGINGNGYGIATNWASINLPLIKVTADRAVIGGKRDIGAAIDGEDFSGIGTHISGEAIIGDIYGATAIRGYRQGALWNIKGILPTVVIFITLINYIVKVSTDLDGIAISCHGEGTHRIAVAFTWSQLRHEVFLNLNIIDEDSCCACFCRGSSPIVANFIGHVIGLIREANPGF